MSYGRFVQAVVDEREAQLWTWECLFPRCEPVMVERALRGLGWPAHDVSVRDVQRQLGREAA